MTAARAYHQRAGKPIDITEWGVQSRNPSPFVNFSQAQQAEYINEGEHMAWLNPRVPAFSQFLLVDDAPNTHRRIGAHPVSDTRFLSSRRATGNVIVS